MWRTWICAAVLMTGCAVGWEVECTPEGPRCVRDGRQPSWADGEFVYGATCVDAAYNWEPQAGGGYELTPRPSRLTCVNGVPTCADAPSHIPACPEYPE